MMGKEADGESPLIEAEGIGDRWAACSRPLGFSPCRNADTVEALLQSLVFRLNLTRQARAKLREELPLRGDLILPIGTIDLQQFFERASGQIESLALDTI